MEKTFAQTYQELESATAALLATIKTKLPEFEDLLARVGSLWHGEDSFYRFYHQSLKVYGLQSDTEQILAAPQGLYPERELNAWFRTIVAEGTAKTFTLEHNERWLLETRPILEAFFHAKTMLECVVKYGRELEGTADASKWLGRRTLFVRSTMTPLIVFRL